MTFSTVAEWFGRLFIIDRCPYSAYFGSGTPGIEYKILPGNQEIIPTLMLWVRGVIVRKLFSGWFHSQS